MDRRERAKPLTPDERRAAIMAATRTLILDRPGELTTKQIAEAAGVAEGTIYRVFPSKRDLLWAVAEETMRPPGAREQLERAVADAPDLESRVRIAVQRMHRVGQEVLEVMMALRQSLMSEPHDHAAGERPGPPPFIQAAAAELLEQLTEVVFAPHADRLRVPPDRAAMTLRSLVVGATHPGLRYEVSLSDDEIVDIVLHGLAKGN